MSDPEVPVLPSLASIEDFEVRHGDVTGDDERAKVEQLLLDASSLIRNEARLDISRVVSAELDLDGDGSRRLLIGQIPVVGVDSVEVDGEGVLPSTSWRWWGWGGLDRMDGARWPRGPRTVRIVCSYGWSPVPDWLVGLCCAMVFESCRPQVTLGESSITTGSQTVSYVMARANLYLPSADAERVAALRGPVL